MTAPKYPISKLNIPIVDQSSNRIAGGFCSTPEPQAVSTDEIAALAKLKELREKALVIKKRLKTASPQEKKTLQDSLAALRLEADAWKKIREEANREKHIALGHVTIPTY